MVKSGFMLLLETSLFDMWFLFCMLQLELAGHKCRMSTFKLNILCQFCSCRIFHFHFCFLLNVFIDIRHEIITKTKTSVFCPLWMKIEKEVIWSQNCILFYIVLTRDQVTESSPGLMLQRSWDTLQVSKVVSSQEEIQFCGFLWCGWVWTVS